MTGNIGKSGKVLVVGGGIAGIQSSLDLASSGFKVYLLDNASAIGGTMAKLDKTFPTNDCAMCTLAPKLVEAGRHENVEIITLADVMGIEGEPGNFQVHIRKRPRYVDENKCTGCGACTTACPVRNKPHIEEEEFVPPLDDEIREAVEEIAGRYEEKEGTLISILQDVQTHCGYLPKDVMEYLSYRLKFPLSQIYGVATFYNTFSLEPRGRHLISVCLGTACHVRGAPAVLDEMARQLKVEPGHTTDDMEFTLETVNCLGACASGPIVVVDGEYYAEMTLAKVKPLLEEYRNVPTENKK